MNLGYSVPTATIFSNRKLSPGINNRKKNVSHQFSKKFPFLQLSSCASISSFSTNRITIRQSRDLNKSTGEFLKLSPLLFFQLSLISTQDDFSEEVSSATGEKVTSSSTTPTTTAVAPSEMCVAYSVELRR